MLRARWHVKQIIARPSLQASGRVFVVHTWPRYLERTGITTIYWTDNCCPLIIDNKIPISRDGIAMCGRIWTPPFCNALFRAGLASRLLTYIRLLNAARSIVAASPPFGRLLCNRLSGNGWISARFFLIGSKASAFALPVHTSGLRSYGTCRLTIPCQVAAILSGVSSFIRFTLSFSQAACGVSGPR